MEGRVVARVMMVAVAMLVAGLVEGGGNFTRRMDRRAIQQPP